MSEFSNISGELFGMKNSPIAALTQAPKRSRAEFLKFLPQAPQHIQAELRRRKLRLSFDAMLRLSGGGIDPCFEFASAAQAGVGLPP